MASVVDLFADLPLAEQRVLADVTVDVHARASPSWVSATQSATDAVAFEAATLANLRAVQERNGIAMSEALDGMHFSVEMETGTGKTYVYLRTIFELNKRYGFTKFVIVVPNVAIREGVLASIELSRDHLRACTTTCRSTPASTTPSTSVGSASSQPQTRSSCSS